MVIYRHLARSDWLSWYGCVIGEWLCVADSLNGPFGLFTSNPEAVSVVGSTPTGGRLIFKPLNVNSGLKCKLGLIVKNLI